MFNFCRKSFVVDLIRKQSSVHHNTQIQSMPYQQQCTVKTPPFYENTFQQQQQRLANQQSFNQNHPYSTNGFILMPINLEFCDEEQYMLRPWMYERSLAQTKAEQVTQFDSVYCLQQLQPT